MAKAKVKLDEIGNLFGRPDIERIGLFVEMPYMNGKGYVSPFPKPKRNVGKSMLAEGPKIKAAKQDCYFDKEFKRLFTGEAIRGRGKKPVPTKFKNVSLRPMIPTGRSKLHSTPGDYYGTFSGNIEYFSNKRKPVPPYKKQDRNFLAGPNKMGGPGYADICINKYPEHMADRYGTRPKYKEYGKVLDGPFVAVHFTQPYFDQNPFQDPPNVKPGPFYVRPKDREIPPLPPGKIMPTGPAKWQGGCHAGCFDKFPEHMPDKYKPIYEILKPHSKSNELESKFHPQSMALKSYYTTATIPLNINFRVNSKNAATYEPTYIRHLVD